MVSKNISITEEAYNILARRKKFGESFSEVIIDNFKGRKNLLEFAGAWSEMPEKDFREIKKNIKEVRKRLNKSFRKKIKGLQYDRNR